MVGAVAKTTLLTPLRPKRRRGKKAAWHSVIWLEISLQRCSRAFGLMLGALGFSQIQGSQSITGEGTAQVGVLRFLRRGGG